MHVNPFNKVEDRDAMLAFIKKYNFGMLVSTVKNRLWATHFPFILQQKGEQLLNSKVEIDVNLQFRLFTLPAIQKQDIFSKNNPLSGNCRCYQKDVARQKDY